MGSADLDRVDSLLDEIDDLLDDSPTPPGAVPRAGSKSLIPPPCGSRAASSASLIPPPGGYRAASAAGADTDVERLLSELDVDSPAKTPPRPVLLPRASASSSTTVVTPLGGIPGGRSSGADDDSGIRCARCDFKVVKFDDKSWDAGADYMFFRNASNDRSKLAAKLVSKPGCSAYCCQCLWASVDGRFRMPHDAWFYSSSRSDGH